MTALAFENPTIAYDRHPEVHHLDAKVGEGSLLAIVGALYSDALSAEDGPASTHLEMLRHNVGALTAVLGS